MYVPSTKDVGVADGVADPLTDDSEGNGTSCPADGPLPGAAWHPTSVATATAAPAAELARVSRWFIDLASLVRMISRYPRPDGSTSQV